MKIIKKGNYGYIKFQRKVEIVKTLFMLILCLAVYYIGYYTAHTNKNLLTFVAVLGVLPMARSAVNAVLFIKAKSCSKEVYDKLEAANVKCDLYDLYMTEYKDSFSFSALIYKKDCLILLTEDDNLDEAKAKEHIEKVLKNASIENKTIKIYKEVDKFIERGIELSKYETEYNEVLFDNLKSVSI